MYSNYLKGCRCPVVMVTMVLGVDEILKGKLIKFTEKDETEYENKDVVN